MSIDPEVIPSESNEGINAIEMNRDWYPYLFFICLSILAIVVLKLLIESILISLGLLFIWRLATS